VGAARGNNSVCGELPNRQDFSTIATGDDALLLQTSTGSVFALNRTARFIWEGFLTQRSLRQITQTIRDWGEISAKDALATVEQVLQQPLNQQAPPPRGFDESYRFSPERDGVTTLFFKGDPIAHVFEGVPRARFVGSRQQALDTLRGHMWTLIPKAADMNGYFVLHASAIDQDGSVTAFSGPSGVGKTTTARAFATSGTKLVCEDKLAIHIDETGQAQALVGAETILHEIADDLTAQLSAAERGDLSFDRIRELSRLPTLPLKNIHMLGPRAPKTTQAHSTGLRPSVAASHLIDQLFLGCRNPQSLKARVEQLAHVCATVPVWNTVLPEGLRELVTLAADYRLNTAS